MLEDVKLALRIKSNAYDNEIFCIIEACKKDLKIAGVKFTDEEDFLIKRAIIMYAKAHFGINNPDCEKWNESYVTLKQHLCLSGEYNE